MIDKMGKRKKRKSVFLCFLILCILCGCQHVEINLAGLYHDINDPEGNYRYIVESLNGGGEAALSDDYYFVINSSFGLTNKEIYQFSISEHKVINSYGNGDNIDLYAVCDEYIFFVTSNGIYSRKVWRYDRAAETCELFAEIDKCDRLVVYDGYVFYGLTDIYACPIDGTAGEDSICLNELFDVVSDGESQEISYLGWRIWKEDAYIPYIINEENNEVILTNTYSNLGKDLWLNGEWIIFQMARGGRYHYRRESEQKEHILYCLDDYRDSEIWRLTIEDNKIIGLLIEFSDPRWWSGRQEDLISEALFEIDLETDKSKIIYSTENSKTWIIGYQDGTIYLLEGGVIYKQSLEEDYRETLLDLKEDGWDFFGRDEEFRKFRDFYFDWVGDDLIMWTKDDGTLKIKTISILTGDIYDYSINLLTNGEPATEEVISAYAEYLQQFCDNSDTYTAQNTRFSLAYIDEDNIPELAFFDDNIHPSGAHICVYSDGTVIEIGEFGSSGSFAYSPHENVFLGGFTNMGEDMTSVYQLSEDECVELQFFHSYPQYDENHEYVNDIYEVDGQTVSEEAYREAWEQWEIYEWESLSYDKAILFTDADSACKEMKELLSAPNAEE